MTRASDHRTPRRYIAAATMGVIVALLTGVTVSRANAVTGNAGSLRIMITPTSRVADGTVVHVHADAPRGTLIYQLRAHLCSSGPPITTSFEFGFQGGRRCTNVALGHGDTEKDAPFGQGTVHADLDGFRLGVGSAHWVNDRGYDQTIACGIGHPCDLVVRAEITNDVVFITAPLCYGPACPPEPAVVPVVPTTMLTLPQAVPPPVVNARPPVSQPSDSAAAAALHARPVQAAPRKAPAASARPLGAQSSRVTANSVVPGASTSISLAPVRQVAAPGLTPRERVVLAALASGVAGAWIVAIALRGDALVFSRRRRRAMQAV